MRGDWLGQRRLQLINAVKRGFAVPVLAVDLDDCALPRGVLALGRRACRRVIGGLAAFPIVLLNSSVRTTKR